MDALRGNARIIVINDSWKLAPWADLLYACDAEWWERSKPEFAGLKVSGLGGGDHQVEIVRDSGGRWLNRMVFDRVGVIGAGGNSGFQALNLAVQIGATDIALVGFDMRVDRGIHWHGAHPRGNNPRASAVETWRAHLDNVSADLEQHGISVVNCSAVSALTQYRKVGLREWLKESPRSSSKAWAA
ncbi:MAG: hypothetical protein WBB98_04650 [Xanthobacteraceae bacterium]